VNLLQLPFAFNNRNDRKKQKTRGEIITVIALNCYKVSAAISF
jgi:hypothetical protein